MTDQQFPVPGGYSPVGPPPPAAPAAPSGAYRVPVGGYAAGGPPVGGYQVPQTPPRSRTTGALALVAALLAAVVAPIVSGSIALQIGGRVVTTDLLTPSGELVLAALSPVRTEVLWVEILFWSATVLGVIAIVLGIMAVVRRRGRGLGVTAIVLAVLGPAGFLLLTSILFGVGNVPGLAGVS